jgi:hypothetical protein
LELKSLSLITFSSWVKNLSQNGFECGEWSYPQCGEDRTRYHRYVYSEVDRLNRADPEATGASLCERNSRKGSANPRANEGRRKLENLSSTATANVKNDIDKISEYSSLAMTAICQYNELSEANLSQFAALKAELSKWRTLYEGYIQKIGT